MVARTEATQEPVMNDRVSTHDEIWQLANGLEFSLHLACMSPTDRLHILEPRLTALAEELERSDRIMSESELEELDMLGRLLDDLRAELN